MTRRRLAAMVVAMGCAVAVLSAATTIRVRARVTQGRVLAEFDAPGAWTIEAREALASGSVVSFQYVVELRRPSAFWRDTVLARLSLVASGKLDILTGAYTVSRYRDGRVQLPVGSRRQEDEVRDWLTTFEPFEITPDSELKPNTDYYVQVRLYKAPRATISVWSVLPFGGDDGSGRGEFTYIR
jgi:hypothetical protein